MKKTMMMIAIFAVAVFSGSAYALYHSHSTINDCPPNTREILASCVGDKPPSAPAPAPVAVASSEDFKPIEDIENYIVMQKDFLYCLLSESRETCKSELEPLIQLGLHIETYIAIETDSSTLLMLNSKLLGIQSQYWKELSKIDMNKLDLLNKAQPNSLLKAIEKRMIQLKLSARDTAYSGPNRPAFRSKSATP